MLIGTTKRKRSHRRPRHKWNNNIKVEFRDIDFKDINWIYLA
jgi:hypothetical protein